MSEISENKTVNPDEFLADFAEAVLRLNTVLQKHEFPAAEIKINSLAFRMLRGTGRFLNLVSLVDRKSVVFCGSRLSDGH